MDFSHTVKLFGRDSRLVEHFIDPVIGVDSRRRITFWNYGASVLFGYSNHEVVGSRFDRILLSIDPGENLGELMSFDRLPLRGDVKLKSRLGDCIHCKFLLYAYNDAGGLVLVIRNISEQKALEQLVDRLKVELDQTGKSIEELARLYEQINEGFIAFDEQWNYTHMNKKAAEMVGRDPKELLGKNVWVEFPRAKQSNFYSIYLQAMRTQQYRRIEDYSAELDRWFEIDIFPSPRGLSVLFHDVTELKRTSKLLSQREMLYRNIVETAQEGIWTTNEQNKTTFVNEAIAKMLGYERQEIIGRAPFEFMSKESAGNGWNDLARSDSGEGLNMECQLVTKAGVEVWVLIHATELYTDGAHCGALAMITDITERRRREMELNLSFDQLREFTSRLQNVREEERSAIAREIHDELGQQLTALKMDAYWVAKNLNAADPRLIKRVERISEISSTALDIVEKKVMELHPGILHSLGLLAALEWQNSEFEERFQVSVDFMITGDDTGLPPQLTIALYRIYQEALNNIARHARATSVHSHFCRDQKMVSMEIADDGNGFDTGILRTKRSLGILSMKERSAMLGGNFIINSTIGLGTNISVRIPIQNSDLRQ